MIICVTGLLAAGKSKVAEVLRRMGFKTYELGSVVWENMKERGIEVTPDSARRVATQLRREGGKEVITRILLRRIRLNKNSRVAIIGVRSRAELNYIKKRAKVVTIAVVAPSSIRFARSRKRRRKDDPKTLRQLIKYRDRKEASFGVLGAIKDADYIISNTGSVADLRKGVRDIIRLADL